MITDLLKEWLLRNELATMRTVSGNSFIKFLHLGKVPSYVSRLSMPVTHPEKN